MIYPDIDIEKWVQKYSSFRDMKQLPCKCGKIYRPKPFISRHRVGIINPPCECGSPGKIVQIPRKNEDIISLRNTFLDM